MTSKIIRLSSLISSSASLAAESLSLGHVIAVPTDTIYGITCLVQHSAAVDRLYSIKVTLILSLLHLNICICRAEMAVNQLQSVWQKLKKFTDGRM